MQQSEYDKTLRQKLDDMLQAPDSMQADHSVVWTMLEAKLEMKQGNSKHLWKYIAAIFLVAASLFIFFYPGKKNIDTAAQVTGHNKFLINREPQPPVINNKTTYQEIGISQKTTLKQVRKKELKTAPTIAVDTSNTIQNTNATEPYVEPVLVTSTAPEKTIKRFKVVHINELYKEARQGEKDTRNDFGHAYEQPPANKAAWYTFPLLNKKNKAISPVEEN